MFVQVIHGRTKDAAGLEAAIERWSRELAPDAVGWLGSTGGVTDDGRFIALARFESAEAARRNSERPEQDRWWRETSALLDGEATFADSEEVAVDVTGGDPDRAGFVQVMRGRTSDPEQARELMNQDADKWATFRPDVLGSVLAGHRGGEYTMAMYFTSEAEAREGERKQPPPELAAQMEQMDKLSLGEPEFFDLPHPWIHSPA